LAERRAKAEAGMYNVIGDGMVRKISNVKQGDLNIG